MANIIQQLEDLKEWGQDPTRYERRTNFRAGQLVQPGQPGVRQGYAPKSQKVRKPEARRTVSLKPHEVTIYRNAVEIRAKKRDLRVPDWDNYPGRGYPSDYTPGQTISKDVGRMIKAGKLETVGTGSGAGQAETLLSKVDQDKIKKRFGSKFEGEWNFLTKKNKTGNKWGLPKKGNEELYQQIVNYVKGQHGPNFAFDSFDSANYHLVQMHRAAHLKVKPNKNYVPIYGTKGIIGYIDKTQKGKEYYHADYTGVDSKGKKALLINKHHPDAAELNKLINIVEGTKQEYDDILRPLFQKHGDETPNLNQLIDALLETEGRYDISSAIEKHHQYGVGTHPGKIQLITRDQNQFAKVIEGRIKAGKMDVELAGRILRPAGVQIVVDGKKIGAPDIAPEKQIADWKKWTRRKTLADPIKMLQAAGFSVDQCTNLQGGGSIDKCIKKVVNETIEKAKGTGPEAKAAQQIFKNQKQVLKQAAKRGTGLATKLSWFLGPIDAPIELAFALPHLLMGDYEAAKRATTAGLFGWGEIDLDNVDDPEARKYMKHRRDTENWINNWEKHDYYTNKLENLPDNASPAYRKEIEDEVNKRASNMDSIAQNYDGYDRSGSENEAWAYNPEEMAGKKAARNWIDTKVETDLDKQLDKTYGPSEIMGVDIDLGPYKEEIREKLRASPTDLESYIKTKGQDFYGDPEGWFAYDPLKREEADAHGIGHIYDDYYMGASEGKDIRDAYSSIPLEYASQLGALEAKETRDLLFKKQQRPFYRAEGGIANVRRPDAIPPESGPMPHGGGLSSVFNRVKPW